MNFSEDISRQLKKARLEKGYSQSDVAKKLNISRQAISRWENGLAYPDIENLKLLGDIYDLSFDELLGKETPPVNTFN